MGVLSLIIKREFISKVRNKSFIVMTFVSPLLFVGFAVLVGYLSSLRSDIKHVGIHDEFGLFFSEFKSNDLFKYTDVSLIDEKILKDSVSLKAYEGIVFIPKFDDLKEYETGIQYISEESPSLQFISELEETMANKLTKRRFRYFKN